jgi:alkylhydroperoxidase family enzyme
VAEWCHFADHLIFYLQASKLCAGEVRYDRFADQQPGNGRRRRRHRRRHRILRGDQTPVAATYRTEFCQGSCHIARCFGDLRRTKQGVSCPHHAAAIAGLDDSVYHCQKEQSRILQRESHEVTCRTLGIDEETLAQLVEDLGAVNPLRVKAIIEFALKAAKHPQELVAEDYEYVRDQGVSDEEIVEIILIAAVGVFSDILADSLKIEVDAITRQALNQL